MVNLNQKRCSICGRIAPLMTCRVDGKMRMVCQSCYIKIKEL